MSEWENTKRNVGLPVKGWFCHEYSWWGSNGPLQTSSLWKM